MMKTRSVLCLAALALLAAQGCRKNNSLTSNQTNDQGSKLRVASAPTSYGTFQLTNVSSSKLLEVRLDTSLMHNQNNPHNVQQNASGGSGAGVAGNQKWYFIQQGTGTITNSTNFMIMNVENGMYLEAPNGTSGTTMWVDHSNGFPSQMWNIQTVSGQSYYVIRNANGLVLTDHGASTANGAPITEETFTSSTTQYWNLSAISAEAYRDDVVVNFFHRGAVSNTTVAFDQGNSIPLTNGANNGKVLWITQDAYASSQLQTNGMLFCQVFSYHNSGFLQPTTTNWTSSSALNITTTSNASTGVSELEIIKSPGAHNSTYTWPGAGVEIGSNVYLNAFESANGSTPANQVLYQIAESTSSNTWGAATRLTPNGMSGQTKIGYQAGMIKKSSNDTVYVYGTETTFFNAESVFLARYPTSNPSSWSYWRGHSWATTPDTTSALSGQITIGTGTSAQANVSVNYVNGKYVMMQMDLGYFCDPSPHGIYISTATSPFGPFTAPKLVYTINDFYKDGHLTRYYTPVIHGEFVNGKSELLVTYCLNYGAAGGTCTTTTCYNSNQDPNFYQIKGVRIPYSLIGL